MGDWIEKEDTNSYFDISSGYFTAPISGFYEFQFMARVYTDTDTCVLLNYISTNAKGGVSKTELSSGCNVGGWITASAIKRLSKNTKVCVHVEKGKLYGSSHVNMQFSGKYIGPS